MADAPGPDMGAPDGAPEVAPEMAPEVAPEVALETVPETATAPETERGIEVAPGVAPKDMPPMAQPVAPSREALKYDSDAAVSPKTLPADTRTAPTSAPSSAPAPATAASITEAPTAVENNENPPSSTVASTSAPLSTYAVPATLRSNLAPAAEGTVDLTRDPSPSPALATTLTSASAPAPETTRETDLEPVSTPAPLPAAPASAPAPVSAAAHSSEPVYSKDASSAKPKTTLANVDDFVSQLHRVLVYRGGHDVTLMCIAYTARLAAAVIDTLTNTAVRNSARKLIRLAFSLPPEVNVSLKGSVPASPLTAVAMALSTRLKALVAMLAEWRIMNRMWGIVGMWMSVKQLIRKINNEEVDEKGQPKPIDKFDTGVAIAQTTSLTIYHIFEILYWLSHKKVIPCPPKIQGKMALLSVKAWATYVFMETGRLLIERIRKTRDDEMTATKVEHWNKAFTMNLAWAPLTIHWSTPGGIMPEIFVPIIALYPSLTLMKDVWRNSAA